MNIQQQLKAIGYNKEFTVTFTKVDGTERTITGFLETPTKPVDFSKPVPVKVTQGEAAGQWRSFKPEDVVSITEGLV